MHSAHQLQLQSVRTLQSQVRVGILFDSLQIVFIFVLVRGFDDVAVGVVSRGVAVQDVPAIASMFYSLWASWSV